MKTALLVMTLNEIDGMKVIMPKIKKEWLHEIVFVDGNSTDGTIEYIKSKGYRLFLEDGKGVKKTMVDALNNIESDVIITFSPDGNCVPEIIPDLIAEIKKGYDMVIASRYLKHARSYDDNVVTAFGNWMFTNLVNLLYSANYTDVMNMYRIYKKSLVFDLDLDKESTYATPERIFKTKIGWEPILSIRAAKRKLKIQEIPGDEPARIGGKAKLQVIKWGSAYLFQVLRELFFWK